jgi:Flp pilus assembly CpaE family ATPase
MNKATLNVLLIEDNPDYAGLVQQWLAATSDQVSFVLIWTDTLSDGLNRLSRGGVDVILLDLGLPDSDGVDTYLTARANAPGIPIIGLSAGDSESLALRMIQEGAEDYLVKSSCTADLLVRALRYAVVRRKSHVNQVKGEPGQTARAIGVLGAKGGVGTTTIACYLAGELRRQAKQQVLLADLDIQAGLVSFLMGVEPKYSMLDAAANIERLDRGFWDALVTECADEVQIISSPCLLGGGGLDSDALRAVMKEIRNFYHWVVADLGRLDALSMNLLDQFDELFVITTTSLHSLYQAKRAVNVLVGNGVDREQLRLIVNQADEGMSLSGTDLKSIFGIPVFARLPHDRLRLQDACVGKRLPGPDSEIGKQFVNLARKVAGLPEKPDKRGISELFSFVDRFRKSDDLAAAKHSG